MKKVIAIIFVAAFVASCGNKKQEAPVAADSTSVMVDTTVVVTDTVKVADTTKVIAPVESKKK